MKILMYDLARGQTFVERHWRRILPELRGLGYTDVGVYIEMGVHFPSVPLHRPFGGLTWEDALTIRGLAREAGLRLHWFTNTLGHCGKLLSDDHYRHLAETPENLFQICPSHPDTRPVLRQMLEGFAPLDESDWLHVGLDEAWHLNSCARCRERGMSKGELYLDHLNWVCATCKSLGKRPAVWGDMLLAHPEILPAVDRDVIVFDWQYRGGTATTLRYFRDAGFDVVASPSTNDYGAAIYPFGTIEEDIVPFARAARETGCLGVCQTVWEMFNGALWDNGWHRVAAAAAAFDGQSFDSASFAGSFFGSREADPQRLREFLDERRLAAIDERMPQRGTLRAEIVRQSSAWSTFYRYFHRLYGSTLDLEKIEQVGELVGKARPVVAEIQRAATKRRSFLKYLGVPLDLHKVACDRIALCRAIRETCEALHPHRVPDTEGTRRLAELQERVVEHARFCAGVAELLEGAVTEVGAPAGDARNLRSQIAELEEVGRYIAHHRDTYSGGEPVPSHELWFV
jgi:hypothetical protein